MPPAAHKGSGGSATLLPPGSVPVGNPFPRDVADREFGGRTEAVEAVAVRGQRAWWNSRRMPMDPSVGEFAEGARAVEPSRARPALEGLCDCVVAARRRALARSHLDCVDLPGDGVAVRMNDKGLMTEREVWMAEREGFR